MDAAEPTLHVTRHGEGPPVVLLHGYPQTHRMWDRVVPGIVAAGHEVVAPDLRGYGDSDKPAGDPGHRRYAKRTMAADVVRLMDELGHDRFAVVGHDRGARVGHRLALDHPERVERLAVLDIAPTLHMVEHADAAFATGYYHWFLLAQPDALPERLVGADPEYYLREKLRRWSAPGFVFDEDAVRDYVRCFATPEAVHASCEDYRAALGPDLDDDRASRGQRLACPLLVLWGAAGFVARTYDVLDVWRGYADDVRGHAVPGGHFCAEESPAEVLDALVTFLAEAGEGATA